MMNRKVSSIYSKIWLSGPQSPLPPGKTVTTFFPPSFIHSTSATLPQYAHLCVGCCGHSRHKWDSSLPLCGDHDWVRRGALNYPHVTKAWKWRPERHQLCLRWYRVGEGVRAQNRQSGWFCSFEEKTTSVVQKTLSATKQNHWKTLHFKVELINPNM